jgi:hypothetical protein
MRRIKLILAAVAAMVALLAATFPGLAMAQDLSSCESVGYDDFGDELYLCGADDVVDDFGEVVPNCALIGYDRSGDEQYLCAVDAEDDSGEDEEDGFGEDEEDEDDLFDDE